MVSAEEFVICSRVVVPPAEGETVQINQAFEIPMTLRYDQDDEYFYSKFLTFFLRGFRKGKTVVLGRVHFDVSLLANSTDS